MLKSVGVFEAKTHFSRLLEQVSQGDEVVITRHGKPVARLVRPENRVDAKAAARRRKALQKIFELRDRLDVNATHEDIKAAIDEGRR